jgi:hypothetical protein
MSTSRRVHVMLCLLAVTGGGAACADSGDVVGGHPVTPRLDAMDASSGPSAELLSHAGLSAFPRIRNGAVLAASLHRHNPGFGGTILLNVMIDEAGAVRSVDAAPRREGTHARAVLVDRTPNGNTVERPLVIHDNPALLDAARRVMQEAQFTPAERDGKPVSYSLRMTLSFDSPR